MVAVKNLPKYSLHGSGIIPVGSQVSVGQSLRPAISKIVEALNPEKVILFGSFAYGTPTPDSDVDLLVIMETADTQKDRNWAVSRLLLPRPFPVDILVKTSAEITEDLQAGDFFIREILARGQVLYEHHK